MTSSSKTDVAALGVVDHFVYEHPDGLFRCYLTGTYPGYQLRSVKVDNPADVRTGPFIHYQHGRDELVQGSLLEDYRGAGGVLWYAWGWYHQSVRGNPIPPHGDLALHANSVDKVDGHRTFIEVRLAPAANDRHTLVGFSIKQLPWPFAYPSNY